MPRFSHLFCIERGTGRKARGPQLSGGNKLQVADFDFPSLCKTKGGFFYFFFNFILFFKLYIIVLVLPNIKMNPSQVYMCSPS